MIEAGTGHDTMFLFMIVYLFSYLLIYLFIVHSVHILSLVFCDGQI